MIGILVPSSTYKHEIDHFYELDSIINQYKNLAKEYQIDVCMYSYKQIEKNSETVEALVYSFKQANLTQKIVSIPQVNLVRNTSYVVDQKLIDTLELLRNHSIHFINLPLYTQLNKLQNYEHLYAIKKLKDHVPSTKILSLEHLNLFIEQYGKVIIKPIYGSKGRGITIIEKNQDYYQISQTSSTTRPYTNNSSFSRQKTVSLPHSQLKLFYSKAFSRPSSFLVQAWIPFKEYNGLPFDIRAVVQKNGENKWQLSSRVARVASEKGHITNISQGGEMVSLSKLQLKGYHQKIRKFCLKIAKSFTTLYPWVAEMGIDLAIDKNGKLWYIETNFCPEKTKWSTIYKIPFEYAYHMYTKHGSKGTN